MYAEIVFPLPFKNSFSYSVPEELEEIISPGQRVTAPFGKRVLTGFVTSLKETIDSQDKIKAIIDILDTMPVFNETTLKFYNWIAEYYFSSLGEALKNSVPAGLEVETKRKIVAETELCRQLFEKEQDKNSTKAKLLEILSLNEVSKISTLQKEVKKNNIYSILRTLEKHGLISIIDEIEEASVRIKTLKYVRLAKSPDEIYDFIPEMEKRSPRQVAVILFLLGNKNAETALTDLLEHTKSAPSSVKALEEKGLVEIFDKEIKRNFKDLLNENKNNFDLTEEQSEILSAIESHLIPGEFKPFLLHGITGSGKTQVYIELAKKVINEGKTVLILVPEISLTPQMTTRLYNHFGDLVSVLHSRMSKGERYDSWRSIVKGETRLVVGARSALFAPLANIGLIVVDEEHDQSYKQQDLVPKYHARDAAVVMAQIFNCPVILGSATPSVESMYNAGLGKYTLLEMKKRVDHASLPEIKLINMLQEKKRSKNDSIFSKRLLDDIKKRLDKKETVIILQNRRGFSTQVYCEDCGEIITCTDCSVPMVHHIYKNQLACHYCGSQRPVPKACTTCGSLALKFFGTGTQRVEDELEYYFPEARIARVDSDTITKKGSLAEILNDFRKGEIDILVGTQMVSKGLDFENVTLVGVISAETSLWMPDFRADERTFQLLTQVSGRAGRSTLKGEVLIQTQDDNNFVLKKVLENDYKGFFEKEIHQREMMNYPPFCRMCMLEFKDENENNARGAANDFYNEMVKFRNYINVFPPTPAILAKLKNKYRFQLVVKVSKKTDSGGAVLRKALSESIAAFNQKSRFRNVKYYIDIDPQNIL